MRRSKEGGIISGGFSFRPNETGIARGALSCGCGKIRAGQECQRICYERNAEGSGWETVGELMRIKFIRRRMRRIDLAGVSRLILVVSAW